MSYSVELLDDAKNQLRDLPVTLQESVLDLVDWLATSASSTTTETVRFHRLIQIEERMSDESLLLVTQTDHSRQLLEIIHIVWLTPSQV
ncbi:MAG: hypothetical protein AAF743_04615 [Planctomycetota bacterium]